MEYMLLIYLDEKRWDTLPWDERRRIAGQYFSLADEMRDHGVFIVGAPLQATTTSSTVRVRDEDVLVTHGPFAQTAEQLGGYFLIEVGTDEEARAWAAKLPAARHGSVEVRPIEPLTSGALAA